MDVKQLKIIAVRVGYEAKVTPSRCSIATYPYSYCPTLVRWKLYNPLTNPAQLLEVMEKFKVDVRPINNFWVASARGGNTSKADTIKEAIMAAVEKIEENG